MIIFDVLKKDHDHIKDILDKIDKDLRAEGSESGALFERLRLLVLAHSRAEEEVFYAVLEEHDRTEQAAEHGEQEHEEVEELLTQMLEDTPGDGAWRMSFEQMAAKLRHHIREEEGEMFRAARDVLGELELEAMAELFLRRKERVLGGSEQEAPQRHSA